MSVPRKCRAAVAGCCKYGNKPSISVTGGVFFDYMNGYWFFDNDFAQWS